MLTYVNISTLNDILDLIYNNKMRNKLENLPDMNFANGF